MKIKENLILKPMGDEFVVVPVGEGVIDFKIMVTLNETGAFLWNELLSEKNLDELTNKLLAEYNVDNETAKKDVAEFVDILRNNNLIYEKDN